MNVEKKQSTAHIFVNAFARLHMGFLDLNGSSGRRFGSFGLGLNAPDTLIELAIGNHVFGHIDEPDYVVRSKRQLLAHANLDQPVSIKIHREIPRHFGLGSGTQMALAIGAGINQLFGLDLQLTEIAHITGRGLRSGIGIGTFADGGLVLDGGRSEQTKVPPIIVQQPFPNTWRVLLIFDHRHQGVHGDEELRAFANLKDADWLTTQHISHQILMKALPALKEGDLNSFAEAVVQLQAYTGDYFAPVQGGRFASKLVAKVLNFLTENGVLCVGQSSWGPTGFAVFESNEVAEQNLQKLKATFQESSLSWLVCEARHEGASINEGNKPQFSV